MRKNFQSLPRAFLVICSLALLLTACNINIDLGNSQPAPVAATATSGAIQSSQGLSIKMNLNGVAQADTTQTVVAVPPSSDGPGWESMPAYTVINLSGYPIQNHLMKPQLFIFPAGELAKFNEGASQMADELRVLLQNHQVGRSLPFLPLFNAAQVMHTQVKYLDFQNGKGVRYLTQFDQAPLPINNHELFYAFQGLTNDGKYYLAAILPVNQGSLPADDKVNESDMDAYMKNFPALLASTVDSLNQLPSGSFAPDLVKLDGMIQSIEIK